MKSEGKRRRGASLTGVHRAAWVLTHGCAQGCMGPSKDKLEKKIILTELVCMLAMLVLVEALSQIEGWPEHNFIGMIIGPRGNTLKKISAACGAQQHALPWRDWWYTGATVMIRGKDSMTEGKYMIYKETHAGKDPPGHGEPCHVIRSSQRVMTIRCIFRFGSTVLRRSQLKRRSGWCSHSYTQKMQRSGKFHRHSCWSWRC